jgi:hypothetical protein
LGFRRNVGFQAQIEENPKFVVKIVFATTIFTFVFIDFLKSCQTIPKTVPCSMSCSAVKFFPRFVLVVASILRPVIILSGIISQPIPRSVAIQGFIPDVVIISVKFQTASRL